jgi:hypothetical protein
MTRTKDFPPPTPRTVAEALDAFVSGLELDTVAEVRAAQARVLAAKLDAAHEAGEGAAAVAAASKELRAVVDAMLGANDSSGDLLAELFGPGDDD